MSLDHIPNNEAGFELFFKKYFQELCLYCQYKFGFDSDLAKDTVHSAFLKLWEHRRRLPPDLSARAWLYKIITHASLDILKHEQVKRKHEQRYKREAADEQKHETNEADHRELKSAMDRAITELPAQMRQIFELSRYHGLKYADIASRLNISVKTVETQISRALARLKGKLSRYLPILLITALTILHS